MKYNTSRLLHLATFLETDPRVPDHFNMATWAEFLKPGQESGSGDQFQPWVAVQELGAEDNPTEIKYPRCGTVACALGWAAAIWTERAEEVDSWFSFGASVFEVGPYDWSVLNRELFHSGLPGDHIAAAERIRRFVEENPST